MSTRPAPIAGPEALPAVAPRPEELPGQTDFERELLAALPQLRGYVTALATRGPGAQDADDLMQDLAAKALRYRHAYDDSRSLLPWLRRAALHLVLDARRAATRRPRLQEPETEPAIPTATTHSAQRDELERLLARLEPLPRDLLLRFHRDGQSVVQIAVELNLPEGTVKSHLHRARKRLRTSPGASP